MDTLRIEWQRAYVTFRRIGRAYATFGMTGMVSVDGTLSF